MGGFLYRLPLENLFNWRWLGIELRAFCMQSVYFSTELSVLSKLEYASNKDIYLGTILAMYVAELNANA